MILRVDALPRDDAEYGDVVLVIDVLRTCTVVPLLFELGLTRVSLSPSLKTARRAASATDSLLLGERQGLPLEGFNYGNSPTELSRHTLPGREAVLVSENAPRSLPPAERARAVVLASLSNADAAAAWAARNAQERIDLVCCGFRGGEDVDDLLAAGYLLAALERKLGDVEDEGAAGLARSLLRLSPDPLDTLWHSRAGRSLRALGLEADLAACARVSVSEAVPRMGEPSEAYGGLLYPFTRA